MPGVYKEKTCPTCGTKHRKKGIFCSKTCSNKGRDEQYKEKMRDTDYYTATEQETNNKTFTLILLFVITVVVLGLTY
mgnify:CR=1 FL=1